MIVDHRIYGTIYAVAVLTYGSSLMFVGNDRAWKLTFGGSLTVIALTGLANFLDWLWS